MLKLVFLQINRYAGFCRTNPAPAGERHFANERAARLSFPRRGIARAFDKDTFQNTNSGRRAPTPFPARSTVRASTRPKQQSVLTKTAQNTERERPQRSGTKSPPARHPCPQSPHTRKPRFSSFTGQTDILPLHSYYVTHTTVYFAKNAEIKAKHCRFCTQKHLTRYRNRAHDPSDRSEFFAPKTIKGADEAALFAVFCARTKRLSDATTRSKNPPKPAPPDDRPCPMRLENRVRRILRFLFAQPKHLRQPRPCRQTTIRNTDALPQPYVRHRRPIRARAL